MFINSYKNEQLMNIKFLTKLTLIITISICFWLSFLIVVKAESKPIIIGMSGAFNGSSANIGRELYQGSMAYFDYINDNGGIKGHPILLKAYDDGYNPFLTIKNTMNLVEKDQVLLLFNYVGTPTVTKILPLLHKYESKNILLFFPFTGAQPHRQPPFDEFVFNLRPSYQQETGGLVEHFLSLNKKRIAVFYQIDSYGRSGWNGVRKKLKESGLSMVTEATYYRGKKFNSDFSSQVEILKKSNPDAIISIASYEAAAGFIRDARNANLKIPIANISFTGSDNLLGLLETINNNNKIDYTDNLINSQVIPSYEDLTLSASKEYRLYINKYQKKIPNHLIKENHVIPKYSLVSFEGFLNAKLLVKILENIPNLDEVKNLKSIIENMNNIDIGINIPIKFSPESHQALNNIYYTTIIDGKNTPIQNGKSWLNK